MCSYLINGTDVAFLLWLSHGMGMLFSTFPERPFFSFSPGGTAPKYHSEHLAAPGSLSSPRSDFFDCLF